MKSIQDPPEVNVPEFLHEVGQWEPYRPEGYPITDPFHNPWVVVDPISGKTSFEIWRDHGRPDGDELRTMLDALTATKKPEIENVDGAQSFWRMFA